MKIHEYQAKNILKSYGISIPEGEIAETPDEARRIAKKMKRNVIIKAQIHAGGRGKGGGIRPAGSPEEAKRIAGEVIGMNLVTHQTGPEGRTVRLVLVQEDVNIEEELYLGITLDRSRTEQQPVIMASSAGGMEIEEIAEKRPEAIVKVGIDPLVGISGFQARRIAFGLGLDYLFMPVYALTISLSVLMASRKHAGAFARLGAYIGWAALLSALFDVIENFALWRLLSNWAVTPFCPRMAAANATIKFVLILVGILFALAGWLLPEKGNKKTPSQ